MKKIPGPKGKFFPRSCQKEYRWWLKKTLDRVDLTFAFQSPVLLVTFSIRRMRPYHLESQSVRCLYDYIQSNNTDPDDDRLWAHDFSIFFFKNFYYQMMRAFPLSNQSTLNRRGLKRTCAKPQGGKCVIIALFELIPNPGKNRANNKTDWGKMPKNVLPQDPSHVVKPLPFWPSLGIHN